MKLHPLTLEQCQTARIWRNECLETLRTPYALTEDMQESFYKNTICNPNSPHRYWGVVVDEDKFIGMGGITNIQWENRIGEISLIIAPKARGQAVGQEVVRLLLEEAFHRMNLNCVYGECYKCNCEALGFWRHTLGKYRAFGTTLRHRKFWDGVYYDSLYFDILREEFEKCKTAQAE